MWTHIHNSSNPPICFTEKGSMSLKRRHLNLGSVVLRRTKRWRHKRKFEKKANKKTNWIKPTDLPPTQLVWLNCTSRIRYDLAVQGSQASVLYLTTSNSMNSKTKTKHALVILLDSKLLFLLRTQSSTHRRCRDISSVCWQPLDVAFNQRLVLSLSFAYWNTSQ